MKKKTVCISICILLIIAVLPTSGTIVEKSSILSFGGNTLYVGGNGTGNYTKIQDAIDNASDGDTVFVYDDSSPYYENVIVDVSINLIGEDRNTTVIDGSSGDVVYVSADWVNISGFTIRNGDCSGINIGSSYNTIMDNTISNNYLDVRLINSSNNTISNNNISNSRIGIFLEYDSNSNVISGNNVSNNEDGIEIHASSDNNTISNNNITNNQDGVFIYDLSSRNIVSGNIISLNDQIGVHLYNLSNTIVSGNIISLNDKGMLLSYSSGNTISDNIISLNNRGIEIISYSSDNTISNNNISNNEYGVMLRRFSNNNNIFRNIISLNSGYGIYIFYPLYEPCNNNLFYHNNLIDNTQNAYDEGNNSWDNGYPSCGNFWSDYSDVDNFHGENQNLPGQDGVGDTPYLVPGGNNKDRYPLMEPYGMTKLEIYIGKYWYYRLPISIMNVGNNTAFNVQWSVTIDGGFILFGRESSNGISRPLLPGEEVTVSSGLILFGFGKIKIMLAAWADNAPMVSGTISGFLFLFFIKINPGG